MSSTGTPLVTTEELQAFHAQHFGTVHVPGLATTDESHTEDDELGYYPDGQKRTLTDDQIAIFRHSEIQAILRERRLRAEDRDNESESPEPRGHSESILAEVAEPAAERTTAESPKAPRSTSARVEQKRKWGQYVASSEDNPDRLTHRRLARELDEQARDSTTLLYEDDDSSRPKQSPKVKGPGKRTEPPASGRRIISYGD